MPKLFLLKGEFVNEKISTEMKFFCIDCATIEGMLRYFPFLNKELEVNYIDYKKPRKAIVELIGEENQNCPVLVFEDRSFISGTQEIIKFLYTRFEISQPLP